MTRRPRVIASASAAVVAVAIAVVGSASDSSAEPSARSATPVEINLARKLQVWNGFGTSERVFSDPHVANGPKSVVPPEAQRKILRLLYADLGLTRLRAVLDRGIQSRRSGPFNLGGKLGESHVALVKQARPFGLRTFFPAPVYLEKWLTPSDVGGYVDYAMGVLRYWRSKGVEPPLYAPLNEPRIAGDFPPQWMHDVVVQLGRRLDAEGFRTKLVIPDDENPVDAYRRAEAVLADPAARQYVAALAYHIYKGKEGDWARFKELAAKYDLQVWMTEWNATRFDRWPDASEWAVTIHNLITAGGVSAIDYLWGFFGDWRRGESYIQLHFEGGEFRSYTINPIYYLTGQWSRYVRPGYRRVVSSPEKGSALTTAFRGPKRIVIVSINVSSGPQTIVYRVRGGRLAKKAKVLGVRTSPTENWKVLRKISVPAGSRFTAVLPVRSVTTFVVPLAQARRSG